MEIPLSQPLLMDGAARTNLWLEGMPMYSCPAQWMLEHPERVQKLQREFLQAGSRMLCTPTGTGGQCDPAKVGRTAADGAVQRAHAMLTVESCRRAEQKTLAAGVIAPLELLAEPFGETPFFELVNI